MSRGVGGEVIVVKNTNNVYTALVAVAVVVEILGLVALLLQHNAIFKESLFG